MKYEQVKLLSDEQFRRLTGVKRTTFKRMTEILSEADSIKKSKGGRKSKLSIENQLLMTLEYMREYRTYFHVSQNYEISESSAYKIIKWIENTLVKDPNFALPGRRTLLKSDMKYDVVLIDTTETPIERPKKDKSITTQEKRKNIR